MAITSGASHGVSAFVTLMVGTMLSKYVWALAPPLGELSLLIVGFVETFTGGAVYADRQLAGTLLVMCLFSFLWGVGYHFKRHS